MNDLKSAFRRLQNSRVISGFAMKNQNRLTNAGGSLPIRLAGFKRFAVLTATVLALAASAAARGHEETERVSRTMPFLSGGTLELHNFSGDVHITGTTGSVLVIKAIRRADPDRLHYIALDIHPSGAIVIIGE